MIIDTTYFRNKLMLPQIGNPQGLTLVTSFMEQYEDEYLQCALGYDLGQAFAAGIEGSGPPDPRWDGLLNGDTFTFGKCTQKWMGFMNDKKQSPIANYVYYNFVENKIIDFVLTGAVVSDTENNRTVSSEDLLVDAWNRMVDMNHLLLKYLRANKGLYPEWKRCNCECECNCGCNNKQYFGCRFDVFRKLNSLGL